MGAQIGILGSSADVTIVQGPDVMRLLNGRRVLERQGDWDAVMSRARGK